MMQYELSAQQELISEVHSFQPNKLLITTEGKQEINKKPCKIIPLLTLYGKQILNIGPDFKVFLPTLICFILFLQGTTYLVCTSKNISKSIKDSTLSLNLLQNISYLLCGLVNPGVITANERQASADEELNLCRVCNIYGRPTTYHCSDCNACIKGYDHHCPWVGKCIGRGNILFFCVFVLTTMVSIIYNFIALILVASHADD